MGGGSAPTPPDPYATATAQYEDFYLPAAQKTMQLNSIERGGPFGNSSFAFDANGNPTGINMNLSGPLQGAGNSTERAAASQAGLLPTSAFNPYAVAPNTSQIGNAFYQAGANLLEPQFAQQNLQQDVDLTNRGLPIGSEARNIAEGNLARNQGLALNQLAGTSIAMAPQEQQRQIQNALQAYTLPSQMTQGNLALLSGMNNLIPQASQPQTNVQAPNYMGMVESNYQNQLNQYNQDQASLGGLLGGIGKAGMSMIPMMFGMGSDERIKEDIREIGKTHDGQTIYRYRYKGDPRVQIGLIAQEVETRYPEAVLEVFGVKHVNYDVATRNAVR